MDDVRAIMDAVGSETAALMGVSEGGPMSILFAATYPERTRALVLCGAEVKEETTDDWPWGESTRDGVRGVRWTSTASSRPGARGSSPIRSRPSRAGDEQLRAQFGRLQVQSATPHDAIAFMRMAFDIDVRDVVPSVNAPTLDPPPHRRQGVPRRERAAGSPQHRGRALRRAARRRPRPLGRRRRDPGRDPGVPDRRARAGRAGAYARHRPLHRHRRLDRPCARARRPALARQLEQHNEVVRATLARFRGREIDTAGDGFFATFDGPARAIRCARSIVEEVRGLGLEVRAGLHTGECELAATPCAESPSTQARASPRLRRPVRSSCRAR